MIAIVEGSATAETIIRADFDPDWVDLTAHCIARVHAGIPVYLTACFITRCPGTDTYAVSAHDSAE
jgi:hypothetical protein